MKRFLFVFLVSTAFSSPVWSADGGSGISDAASGSGKSLRDMMQQASGNSGYVRDTFDNAGDTTQSMKDDGASGDNSGSDSSSNTPSGSSSNSGSDTASDAQPVPSQPSSDSQSDSGNQGGGSQGGLGNQSSGSQGSGSQGSGSQSSLGNQSSGNQGGGSQGSGEQSSHQADGHDFRHEHWKEREMRREEHARDHEERRDLRTDAAHERKDNSFIHVASNDSQGERSHFFTHASNSMRQPFRGATQKWQAMRANNVRSAQARGNQPMWAHGMGAQHPQHMGMPSRNRAARPAGRPILMARRR